MTQQQQQRVFPLTELEVESAVNDLGEPFIIVRAKGTMQGEPMVLVGHIDTNAGRYNGMTFIEACEAAEQDAALFGFTIETADDGASREDVFNRAASFITAIRHYRARQTNAGKEVEAELAELPDVPIGGLIKVAGLYYRAPSVPSPIGWHRNDAEGDWFPVDGQGNALLMVESPDLEELPQAVELTPPPEEG